MVDTNISSYNWLCSTMPKKDVWTCYNDDTGNIVTDDEGKQAEAYTTEAYGTYGLQVVIKYQKIYKEIKSLVKTNYKSLKEHLTL